MKKLLHSLLALSLLAAPAHAQSTKAQLNTEVSTNFPDNTTGLITPAILRTTVNDMIASWQQAPQVNAQTGTTYAFVVGDYGKLVTFSNGSATAVTLPQATGSFATWNAFVCNKGAGAVTITPTTSTIGGAATLVLQQSQCQTIVSDGTNYQLAGSTVTLGIGIGTTAITGGTTTRVLYDSTGLVGELPISGTGSVCMTTSCVMTTPTLGVASATSINKVAITAPGTSATLTITDGKTASFTNTNTWTGTDAAVYTFPNATATIPRVVASGAKALATGAIASATCTAAQTDTATGTLTTDAITANFNGDPTAVTGYVPLTTGMLTIIVYPTADNVNFKVCNNTLASITPGAITINWRVIR